MSKKKKKSFLKFNEYIEEQGIQKCQFCGNSLNDCTCSADDHRNVRFKQYEPTTGATGPVEKQIVKTKSEEK